MNSILYQILLQAFYYGIAMMFVFFAVAFMQRGFFWKYVKVRTSLGRLLLVKIRTVLRDHYKVGRIEDGFLIYKTKEGIIRIALNTTDKFIYRSIGINWIDVDEEKNAICLCDYKPVPGFDSQKFSDLNTRALMRPTISSGQEKIILICVILAVLLGLVSIYFGYQNYALAQKMPTVITELIKQTITNGQGTVIAATGTI